ncbi:MAG: energy transducer TonB [Sphingomicrobium sp.]
MAVRWLILAAAMFAAGPVIAQAGDPKAAQNATNWDVFLKFYPSRALAAHEEGAVGFKVTLDSKGAVTGCEITHSSGHPLLDQETCNVIALHAVFKPDTGVSASQVRNSEGMIAWKLPGSTASLSSPQQVQPSELDKVLCKKSVRTGTLAGVERTCMTVREWARQSDEQKQPWDELQGRKGNTHGN